MALFLAAILPDNLSVSLAPWVVITGAVVGVTLWLAGACFSRSLVTLTLVTIGCLAGLYLPRWYGGMLNTMGIAILGAFIMGMAGFVFYRFWVALALGIALAGWAAMIAGGFGGQFIYYAAGTAFLLGITLGFTCPHLAASSFYSILGMTLLLFITPRSLQSFWGEAALFPFLVFVGALVQWKLLLLESSMEKARGHEIPPIGFVKTVSE